MAALILFARGVQFILGYINRPLHKEPGIASQRSGLIKLLILGHVVTWLCDASVYIPDGGCLWLSSCCGLVPGGDDRTPDPPSSIRASSACWDSWYRNQMLMSCFLFLNKDYTSV